MKLERIAALSSLGFIAAVLSAQGLDPALLLKPPTGAWPTYNGDYSGRRFSPLALINSSNVTAMTRHGHAHFGH